MPFMTKAKTLLCMNARASPLDHEDRPNHWFVGNEECEGFLREQLACKEVEQLGNGAYGTGFSLKPSKIIMANKTAKPVVVKTFALGKDWSSDSQLTVRHDVFSTEVKAHNKRLAHKHIVQYKGHFKLFLLEQKHKSKDYLVEKARAWSDKDPAHKSCDLLMGGIVMEKLQSTLEAWTEAENIELLDDKLITALFYQIGSALAYLHRKHHMIHYDLKADNIGIARIKSNGVPHLKLLDFGNVVHFEAKEYKAAKRHSKCFNLDSNECDITNEANIIRNGNPVLYESRNLAHMIVLYSTFTAQERERLWRLRIVPSVPELAERFNEVKMSDPRLKRLLLCMMRSFSHQQISLNRVLKYLN